MVALDRLVCMFRGVEEEFVVRLRGYWFGGWVVVDDLGKERPM